MADRIDYRAKNITRNKEDIFLMMKETVKRMKQS